MSKGGTTVVFGNTFEKPKSLLDALKEIQNTAAMEMETEEGINPMFFSLKDRIDLMVVGMKVSFLNGLIMALLTPFAVGVFERTIPIFGDLEPSLFEQVYALMLALGFSAGYGFFLATMRNYYVGNVARIMIRNLYGGIVLGAVLKMFIVVILFHFIYLSMTPERVASILIYFRNVIPHAAIESAYDCVLSFRPNFLTASWLVVLSTILFAGIPGVSIACAAYRKRKERDDE